MKFIVSLLLVVSLSSWSFGQSAVVATDTSLVLKGDTTSLVSNDSLPNQKHRNGNRIDKMISFAKTLIGTPYRYAGMTPSGFDCSGFINYIVGGIGYTIPRTSYSIAEVGETIKLSDVKPGDLLFFKGSNINSTKVGHVAMVVSRSENEIKIIHSSNARGVAIENIIGSRYYIPRFIKAKRMSYSYDD